MDRQVRLFHEVDRGGPSVLTLEVAVDAVGLIDQQRRYTGLPGDSPTSASSAQQCSILSLPQASKAWQPPWQLLSWKPAARSCILDASSVIWGRERLEPRGTG